MIGDDTFTLTCLHPTAEYRAKDKNAASLALAYHSDTFDMLFTGDMDADAVADMVYNRIMIASSFRIMARSTPYVEGSMRMRTNGLFPDVQ